MLLGGLQHVCVCDSVNELGAKIIISVAEDLNGEFDDDCGEDSDNNNEFG